MNRFQQIMGAALLVTLGVSALGAELTHFQIAGIGKILIAITLIFVILLPLPAYYHQSDYLKGAKLFLSFTGPFSLHSCSHTRC